MWPTITAAAAAPKICVTLKWKFQRSKHTFGPEQLLMVREIYAEHQIALFPNNICGCNCSRHGVKCSHTFINPWIARFNVKNTHQQIAIIIITHNQLGRITPLLWLYSRMTFTGAPSAENCTQFKYNLMKSLININPFLIFATFKRGSRALTQHDTVTRAIEMGGAKDMALFVPHLPKSLESLMKIPNAWRLLPAMVNVHAGHHGHHRHHH